MLTEGGGGGRRGKGEFRIVPKDLTAWEIPTCRGAWRSSAREGDAGGDYECAPGEKSRRREISEMESLYSKNGGSDRVQSGGWKMRQLLNRTSPVFKAPPQVHVPGDRAQIFPGPEKQKGASPYPQTSDAFVGEMNQNT